EVADDGTVVITDSRKPLGNFELTKTIKVDVTPEEAAGLLTFEVKTTVTENGEEVEKWLGKDGKLSDEKVQLTLERDFDFDEETKTYTLIIEDAGIGEYTIIETDKDVDGNDVTVSYKINGGESTTTADATATVEIKDGETTNVEFEDDYDKHTGSIELTKTIKGPVTEEEAKGALTFHISTEVTENGKTVTKYLKADGTLTTKQNEATLTLTAFYHVDGSDSYTLKINNVDLGTYTVIETTKDIEGKNVSTSYKIGSEETPVSGDSAVVSIEEKDQTATVDFEDDYANQTGTLKLTKTIKGDVTPEEAAGLLTFEVTTTEGEGEDQKTLWLGTDGKLTEDKTPLKLIDDFTFNEETGTYTLIINNVVVGGYTITETDKDAEGNDVTVTYTINGGDSQTGDTAEAEVKNGEITNVDFEDDYKNQTGTLELTKTIKGDITPEEIDGALRFEITTEDGKWVGTDGKLTGEKTELTLADFEKISDQNYKLTINEIAIGNYTVTETTKDVDGKDVTVTYKVNGSEAAEGDAADFAIENGETTTVEFQNDYEDAFEKKVLRVDPRTQEPLSGAVIQLLDEEGNVLKEWTSSDEAPEILTGLKPGTIYTIHEVTAPEGYPPAPDSKFVLNDDGSIDEENSNVTEAPDGTLLLTEPEEETKTGTLELTKTIKGDITEEEANGALRFEITTEDGKWVGKDGKLTDQKAELTLADFEKISDQNYKLTINEIEIGNYTVTETTKDVDGNDVTVTYKVNGGEAADGDAADFTIEDGETTTVAFQDDYQNQPGSIELTKTILCDITEEEAEGALTFVITT
ncbi:MAG: hypothetical protein IIY23_05445, partial [Erysipelotrichaceae bacterium]|nr:hypothetical protein [Erysipelotrichaceae bacterium]